MQETLDRQADAKPKPSPEVYIVVYDNGSPFSVGAVVKQDPIGAWTYFSREGTPVMWGAFNGMGRVDGLWAVVEDNQISFDLSPQKLVSCSGSALYFASPPGSSLVNERDFLPSEYRRLYFSGAFAKYLLKGEIGWKGSGFYVDGDYVRPPSDEEVVLMKRIACIE